MELLTTLPSSSNLLSFSSSSLRRRPSLPLLRRRPRVRQPLRSSTALLQPRSQLAASPLPDAEPRSDAAAAAAGGGGKTFDWFAQWYPVAPLCDLDKRRPHGKKVMGLDIVVWWDRSENKWQVFDDRCPHRLAPLSEGRVDPLGRLQCVYHGWCFDGAGNCKYIPQAPDEGPPVHTFGKACVAAYPSIEQNKILWFWPSTDPQYKNISTEQKPPFIPELDDPSYTCTMGIRDLPYGYEVMVENLMDPAHVRYAHRGIMRVPKRPQTRAIADREGGQPMDIVIEKSSISGFCAKLALGYGHFIAPCIFYSRPSDAPVEESTSSENLKESSNKVQKKQRRALVVFMCVPVSPGKSRVIFVIPRNFALWVEKIVPRWIFHIGQNLILDSDLYLLHVEERFITMSGNSNWKQNCFTPTKSDAMVVAFRTWLKRYSNYQIDWGSDAQLPPSPPKEQLMDRYWSHVVQCRSCHAALKGLQALQLSLQIISIASVGIVAVLKQNMMSTITRTAIVSAAILCFIASKWLSHFIHKTFYYHDYDHAFK